VASNATTLSHPATTSSTRHHRLLLRWSAVGFIRVDDVLPGFGCCSSSSTSASSRFLVVSSPEVRKRNHKVRWPRVGFSGVDGLPFPSICCSPASTSTKSLSSSSTSGGADPPSALTTSSSSRSRLGGGGEDGDTAAAAGVEGVASWARNLLQNCMSWDGGMMSRYKDGWGMAEGQCLYINR
jgi:hypothetical protein